MKKRIISVVLAFSLAVANILPVNAQSDLTPDSLEETDTLNDDNKVDTKQEVNEEDNNQISDKEKELNALLTSAKEALKELASQKDIMALVYLTDSYDLKEKPDSSSNSLEKLTSGDTVFIKDIEINDGKIWYFVSHNDKKGYIEKAYLAYSDEDFIAFEDKYVTEIKNLLDTLYALDDGVLCAKSSNYADIAQFPSSYHSYLNALKKAHPNWTFVKQNTNLNWSSVIANEKGAKSLVPGSYVAAYKDGAYGSGGWYYASEAAIKYVMDPRNYLNEDSIFAFELLTYNSSYQTKTAVSKVLANSFMSGALRDNKSMTYATAFYEIGKSLGVSPLFLACRVYQEQGAAGTSPLISGTYSGYTGYYNYFNIGASGSTNAQVIASGLSYAKRQGWNSVYKALKGGSQIVASSYILAGQDTLYLQKYNVTSKNTYNHQYMQNIFAPMSEGASEKKAYMNTGSINNTFVFKIPVYNNMPSSASPKPTENTYNLKFDRNGGDPDTSKYYMYWVYGLKYGTTYKVAKCNYVKSGYDFAGWNTKADGSGTAVADQGSFKNLTKTNGATVTLYAQWVKKGSGNTYTVKYKINGTGTGSMSNQKITYGKTANLKAITFCRTGYIFTGWNTKANGSGKKYGDKA
ncbi:Listeria/Bacterioides repeat-containing protein, partial [Acetitomaculum ruminis DSM 5522]